ncbi:hypothetical protein Tco_0616927, partial [Tanacetum coccineum]
MHHHTSNLLPHKGKEIAKPVTPQSESVSEEDSDPEQARRDKVLGIIDLMRQKNKRMKQEGLNRQIGK